MAKILYPTIRQRFCPHCSNDKFYCFLLQKNEVYCFDATVEQMTDSSSQDTRRKFRNIHFVTTLVNVQDRDVQGTAHSYPPEKNVFPGFCIFGGVKRSKQNLTKNMAETLKVGDWPENAVSTSQIFLQDFSVALNSAASAG